MKKRSCTVFLVSFFAAAISCVAFFGQASALNYNAVGGPITQNLSCFTAINTDSLHPLLTDTIMVGVGNDGFIGRTTGDGAISLFPGAAPLGGANTITPSYAWDDGTDESSIIAKPHPGISGVGEATGFSLSFNWMRDDAAQIKADPASIPSPLFFLGTGLIGLAGFNNRRKSEQYPSAG